MDASLDETRDVMEPKWVEFGQKYESETTDKIVELMNSESFQATASGNAPMMRRHS